MSFNAQQQNPPSISSSDVKPNAPATGHPPAPAIKNPNSRRRWLVVWGLLAVLAMPVSLLAPGWLYVIGLAGLYRLYRLSGLEFKGIPKALVNVITWLVMLLVVMMLIRSQADRFPSPSDKGRPAATKSAAPAVFNTTIRQLHP